MMKCEGDFVFKTIEQKEGGTFVNDKGQEISYNPTFQIKVDEVSGTKIEERTFKFSHDNRKLWDKFKVLDIYEKVVIVFEVEIYKTSVKLVPVDVISEHEPEEE